MGRKKTRKTPKTQRKREKIKPVRRNSIIRKPGAKRSPTPEELIVNEALRASPDMTKILAENDGKLFVPDDGYASAGMTWAAASAQPKKHADVAKFLDMKQKCKPRVSADVTALGSSILNTEDETPRLYPNRNLPALPYRCVDCLCK